MPSGSPLTAPHRDALVELAPVLRRARELDPEALGRVRLRAEAATVLARLPFDVLVTRTVTVAGTVAGIAEPVDVTVAAAELLDWLDGRRDEPPAARDAQWRGATPPSTGWRRVDVLPDEAIRAVVRSGALAVKAAGGQLSTGSADALLDSVVLTVTGADRTRVELTLRTVSALTRMAFLPRGGTAVVDVAGRWTRLAAGYGSVLVERAGLSLL